MIIDIAGHQIGPEHPCFVIAEAGVNHNGNPESARRLIDVAAEAGADAVKFQTFKAEQVISPLAPKATYQQETTGTAESQLEMVKRLELSFDTFRGLYTYAREKGILFVSTPFDEASADFLASLDVPFFKIGSGEITNLPFLTHVAHKCKPMLVSTGMATLGEVDTATQAIKRAGNSALALLHCVSNYPASPSDVNLHAMETMTRAFGVPIGYSDHTLGIQVSLAAVALGACIIEKHFTLDHNLPGPDHRASLEPKELAALVQGIRIVEAALGNGRKEPAASEANTASVVRRSLVAARDIPVGATLTEADIAIRRPGTGLPPAMRAYLIGRTVRATVSAGTLFTLGMLE